MEKIITIQQLTQTANILKDKREQKEVVYKAYREAIEPVEQEIEMLNETILDGFKELGLNNIRLETGENYTRAIKKGLEIVDESLALKWSMDNRAVSINKILVAQKLKEATEAPNGFKFIEREEIRITKPNNK